MAALLAAPLCRAAPSVEDFAQHDIVEFAKLSPDGKYLATSYPVDGAPGLVITRLADRKLMLKLAAGEHRGIANVWWGSSERIVLTVFEKVGPFDQPVQAGELLAMNADGTDKKYLFGVRGDFNYYGKAGETFIPGYGLVIDPLSADPKHILIAAKIFEDTREKTPFKLIKLDIDNGDREELGEAPNSDTPAFFTDGSGNVRYAVMTDNDDNEAGYLRDDDGKGWTKIKTRTASEPPTEALWLSADGEQLFERAYDPMRGNRRCLVSEMLKTQTRKTLACDDEADLDLVISSFGGREPIAAAYALDRPVLRAVMPEHPHFKALSALSQSFPDDIVRPVSSTRDGAQVIVLVHGDRNPGDYYLYDTQARKAAYVQSLNEWLKPEEMARREPIQFKARDGTILHGYLTRPPGSDEPLPLVVNPHGGPFGIADNWNWDADAQLLASRGYAVLQINFRGSGGRGLAFREAGRLGWATTMIDDITDSARWAIEQKIAAPERLCIYGASYGGYAALMSAVREPALYRCAIGYAGIYNLSLWRRDFDNARTEIGRRYVRNYVGGTDEALDAASPLSYLDSLKAALLIVHGTDDERAPFTQAEALMEALDARRYRYERLTRFREGHGFITTDHRAEFYTRMLDFLDRQIGARSTVTAAAASSK